MTKELLDKFNYTKGCPKFEALKRGDDRGTVHHSKECRKRIEQCMSEDPELRRKLSEVEERQNRRLERRIGEHDAQISTLSNDLARPRGQGRTDMGRHVRRRTIARWPM